MSGFFKNKSRKSFHEFFSRSRSASMDLSGTKLNLAESEGGESSTPDGSSSNETKTPRSRRHFIRSRKAAPKNESRITVNIGHINAENPEQTDTPSTTATVNSNSNKGGTQFGLSQFVHYGYTSSPQSHAAVAAAAVADTGKRSFSLYVDAKGESEFCSLHTTIGRSLVRRGATSVVCWLFPACRVKFLTPLSDIARLSVIGWQRTPGAVLEDAHLTEIRNLPLWVNNEECNYDPASDVDMEFGPDEKEEEEEEKAAAADRDFDWMWGLCGHDQAFVIDTDDLIK